MEFTKITINSRSYGEVQDMELRKNIPSNINFSDPSLFDIVNNPSDVDF